MEGLLRNSTLSRELQDAIWARLAVQKSVVWRDEDFTREAVIRLQEPVLLGVEHFVLRDLSLESMAHDTGHIYARNTRGAMEKIEVPVGEAVNRVHEKGGAHQAGEPLKCGLLIAIPIAAKS